MRVVALGHIQKRASQDLVILVHMRQINGGFSRLFVHLKEKKRKSELLCAVLSVRINRILKRQRLPETYNTDIFPNLRSEFARIFYRAKKSQLFGGEERKRRENFRRDIDC